MKYILLIAVIAGLGGCSGRPKLVTGFEGKPMPSFGLLLPDSSTHIQTASIKEGKPVILFSFGPYCPYSRAQMDDMISHMDDLKNYQLYIFTNAPFRDMKVFYNSYPFSKYPNITVGADYADFFGRYYGAEGVPYIAVYDSHKLLKQALFGKSSIGEITSIDVQ
jgi:hypothetical protein